MKAVKELKAEVKCMKESHSAKVECLQEVLKREEQTSTNLRAMLTLEERKRKEVEMNFAKRRGG